MTILIKEICCIGAGYVGGPTMAVIAKHCPKININVVDINEERINKWNDNDLSELPIYEPGLKEIISECRCKNLHFSNNVEKYLKKADMIFISVNTPTKTKGIGAGKASDLKWIEASARQIAKHARNKTIVVEKSTLPVRTAETIQKILKNSKPENENKEFYVLSNPEFLAEGTAIKNLENPDRVLIGGEDRNAINALKGIYQNWISHDKILTTNLWSSELSKLTANAFLAQRISSINSLTALCESTGANIKEVVNAVGTDSRIGSDFLNPGPGFGGSCFKKDILNLIYICEYYGLSEVANYWQKVIDINTWQKERISKIIVNKLFGTLSSKKICILGFAFKSNTNDTRESPAISICRFLLEEGAILSIFDPRVSTNQIQKDLGKNQNNNIDFKKDESEWINTNSVYEAAENADAIVILTEWEEFNSINWEKIALIMRKPAWIFDTRLISNIKLKNINDLNLWTIGGGF